MADENQMINYYHKNSKYNLVCLCESCHNKVHHGNLRIYGYKQTSEGVILDYEEISLNKVNEEKKRKFTKIQEEIIRGYKESIDKKEINKTNLKKILECEHKIKISIGTLTKILENNY